MIKKMLFTFVALLLVAVQLVPVQPAAAQTTFADWASFVADVTVPDGTVFGAGATFTKTWRLKNIGTSTWTTDYTLVYSSGDKMGAPDSVKLTASVAPNGTIDVSANMTAPATAGHYKGLWLLKNASGKTFGIGATASTAFWVDIYVTTTGTTAYDFTANICTATWSSGAGVLPCPGTSGNSGGYAIKVDAPKYEDGTVATTPGILAVPQNVFNGYISGVYPAFRVQSGDKFQTVVNCEFGSTGCYVRFRLDYKIGTGALQTLWGFYEKIDSKYYRASVDLSSLAGQDVKFILTVHTAGDAAGDHAVWGNPIILRGGGGGATSTPGPSSTPKPTNTPGPSPTPKPTTTAACDSAAFVSDVTIPDGTAFDGGKTFTKTWRIKNSGSCTWTTDYKLVFVSGEAMGGKTASNIANSVAPGATIDLSLNLTAPTTAGTYTGYWALKNAAGKVFGLGGAADKPWWVQIKVNSGTFGVVYDFAANACAATWSSGAGILSCPGTSGDAKGYVIPQTNSTYEDGTASNTAGFLTVPQNVYNGYISGSFPAFKVQKGDKFESVINCDSTAKNCYVKFRLDYKIGTGALQTLWSFYEKYEGKYYRASIDLSALAGQDVKFILTTHAAGAATDDKAVWIGARIVRPGASSAPQPTQAGPTATPNVSPSPTPNSSSWLLYQNSTYAFSFKYPTDGKIQDVTDNSARIVFSVPSGTNLGEKYIDVVATELPSSGTCKVDLPIPNPTTQNVTFNGVTFLEQTGRDQGAGQIHDWVAYSTVKNNTCISIMYILHSGNLDMYGDPKPKQFDLNAEIATFKTIMGTFNWTTLLSVVFVTKGDVLNIRSAAGVSNPIVGSFNQDVTNVSRTGASAAVGSETWWEVVNPSGGTGWVNAYYLAESIAAAPFCADNRVQTLLTNLGAAFKNSDGTALAKLTSPKHGLTFYLVSNNPRVTIPPNQVSTLFTSTTPIDWGAAPASGQTVTGTFKEVMLPKIVEVVGASGLQTSCNDLSKTGNVVSPWPGEFATINFYSLYKPGSTGVELDWRTFLVGIEFVVGQPYVVSMVNFQWVP